MKIEVRPARREGAAKCIFNADIRAEHLSADAGAIGITVCASDIYTPGSQHRYQLTIHLHELRAILQIVDI